MRALILMLVPACALYGPSEDPPWYPDAWTIVPDAWRPQPDAGWDGTAPCDVPAPCPPASPGRVSLCGRLIDLETDQPLVGSPASAVWIEFFDALDYAGNPDGAQPLDPDYYFRDACGRFIARDVPRPSLGYLAITTDDAGSGAYRRTALAKPLASGQVRSDLRLLAFRSTTDDAWTTQAGLGAQTFADRGAVFALFTHAEAPVEGVSINRNGSVDGANDFYFSDEDPRTRTTVAPSLGATGPNGAALLLGSSLVEHSGTGGTPPDCNWSSELATAVPSVLWIVDLPTECFL